MVEGVCVRQKSSDAVMRWPEMANRTDPGPHPEESHPPGQTTTI
jgi:hypothetical protein